VVDPSLPAVMRQEAILAFGHSKQVERNLTPGFDLSVSLP